MFKEVLQEVVDGTEGGIAGVLMGYDGITVDHYTGNSASFDVESVGMEYSVVLKNIANAARMLEAGTTNEVSVKTDRLTTLIRPLTEDYFVAVTLHPDGNLGRARFLLRTRASKILENL